METNGRRRRPSNAVGYHPNGMGGGALTAESPSMNSLLSIQNCTTQPNNTTYTNQNAPTTPTTSPTITTQNWHQPALYTQKATGWPKNMKGQKREESLGQLNFWKPNTENGIHGTGFGWNNWHK